MNRGLLLLARGSARFAPGMLFALLLLAAARVAAQDALGGESDFEDGWEAILKLAPPSGSAATAASSDSAPKKSARSEASEDPAQDASDRRKERASGRGEGAERKRERRSGEPSDGDVEARGSAREQNKETKGGRARDKAEAEAAAERPGRDSPTGRAPRSERAGREKKGRESATLEAAAPKREERPRLEKIEPEEPVHSYEGLVRSWHEPWPAHAGDHAIDQIVGAAPVLSVHPVGRPGTPYVLLPDSRKGGFNEAQIAVASQAWGAYIGGPQVSPRLLDLIYRAANHFKIFHVHLVSGIRADRSGSRHSHGLAADIVFPGVSDEQLAAYFRPLGFLGVGIYTRAGFVHVDVREKSFFWLDRSSPGQRIKVVQVRGDEAKMADEAALLRGQSGNLNPPRLQKALHARAMRRMEKARASQ